MEKNFFLRKKDSYIVLTHVKEEIGTKKTLVMRRGVSFAGLLLVVEMAEANIAVMYVEIRHMRKYARSVEKNIYPHILINNIAPQNVTITPSAIKLYIYASIAVNRFIGERHKRINVSSVAESAPLNGVEVTGL